MYTLYTYVNSTRHKWIIFISFHEIKKYYYINEITIMYMYKKN